MSKPRQYREAREAKRYETLVDSAIAETLAMSDEDVLDGEPPGMWKAKGNAVIANAKAKIDIGSGDSWT